MPCLNRAQEAQRILKEYGDSLPRIMEMLERQFSVLHNRAQVLLALCGVVISTTGFSGRLIAGTNETAQLLIIVGIALVLLSTGVVCWMVLHLRWLTVQEGESLADWLTESLKYRDLKTRAYRIALLIMVSGLSVYCGAIAVMLRNPSLDVLPAR
ncbi:MAG: hypothetical protein QM770_19220 [Tepidisphaeraceae bacterium]